LPNGEIATITCVFLSPRRWSRATTVGLYRGPEWASLPIGRHMLAVRLLT
jgi:hypothetical protein